MLKGTGETGIQVPSRARGPAAVQRRGSPGRRGAGKSLSGAPRSWVQTQALTPAPLIPCPLPPPRTSEAAATRDPCPIPIWSGVPCPGPSPGHQNEPPEHRRPSSERLGHQPKVTSTAGDTVRCLGLGPLLRARATLPCNKRVEKRPRPPGPGKAMDKVRSGP